MVARDPEPVRKHRDGHCHEGVMWYVHHLPESLKEVITDKTSLPLLSQIRHDLSLVKLHTVRVQRAYDEKVNCTSSRFSAYPGGKSWDEVPGQTNSGKKFHRNVISGADFTADVRHIPRVLEVMPREWESLNAKAELARMHRDGHCLEAVMLYVHYSRWRELPKGDVPRTVHKRGSLVSPGLATQRERGLTATVP